jgi:salicylate hydroxylase
MPNGCAGISGELMGNKATSSPVLIVGGGIGGLAAALALAQKGVRTRVLEQAGEFKEVGAGIQLGPNVFRMFDVLGLTEAVSALSVFPENLIMLDAISGEEVTRVPLDGRFRAKFVHPYALIYRPDLLSVLLDACRGNDLVELRTSQKVVAVDERGDGVTARTDGGERYDGAALIGADGLWSTIRQLVVGDGKPQVAGHITYRAVLPTKEVPEPLRRWSMTFWAGEKVHLVIYPLRGGDLYNLVAVFHSNRYEEGWDSFGDPAELHERFARTCEPVRYLLGKIESWRMWVLCDRRRSRPGAGGARRSSVTPRIRCCNIWRRAPAWRSRMRSASPTASKLRRAITPAPSRPIRRRAICAPGGCRSWRASTASSITPAASRAICAT